jgi:hypothetical protein
MNRATTSVLLGLLCLAPAWAQTTYPPANSTITSRRPSIGYNFGQPARNMQLFIDGREFTQESNKNGNVINFQPNYDIDPGQHQVEARALNIVGLTISKRWTFTVANPNNTGNNGQQANPVANRLNPAQDSVTDQLRPRISADYPETLRSGKVWLDGNEVTSLAGLSGGSLAFTPNQDLSPGRHQVATQVTYISGVTANSNWSFEVRPQNQNQPSNQQAFTNLSPTSGGRSRNLRPTVAADVTGGVDNLRLMVDNNDFTSQAQRQGNRISWTPSYDLDPGSHQARLEGRLSNGQVVHQEWTFQLEDRGNSNQGNPNQDDMVEFGVDRPLTGDRVRQSFQVTGQGPAGRTIRVVLKNLPGKNKVAQFQGKVDANGNYSIPVTTPNWATKGMRLETTVSVLSQRGRPATDPIVLELYRR